MPFLSDDVSGGSSPDRGQDTPGKSDSGQNITAYQVDVNNRADKLLHTEPEYDYMNEANFIAAIRNAGDDKLKFLFKLVREANGLEHVPEQLKNISLNYCFGKAQERARFDIVRENPSPYIGLNESTPERSALRYEIKDVHPVIEPRVVFETNSAKEASDYSCYA